MGSAFFPQQDGEANTGHAITRWMSDHLHQEEREFDPAYHWLCMKRSLAETDWMGYRSVPAR